VKSKIKPNRFKPETTGDETTSANVGSSIDFCLKWIMMIAGISILSLASIFAYDMVTQSALFTVKKIDIHGNLRVPEKEITAFAGLNHTRNLFKLNIHALEKKISTHPWIASAKIKRKLSSALDITIIEHTALAIVKIENIADIIINTQGQPFKEYNPKTDDLAELPVIMGLDLTKASSRYLFDGTLFNAVMDFLTIVSTDQAVRIQADKQLGITIESKDIYNKEASRDSAGIKMKMGFGEYRLKFKKAKTISAYIGKHFPDKTITAMDLFNLEKVFVTTKSNDIGLETLEKGV